MKFLRLPVILACAAIAAGNAFAADDALPSSDWIPSPTANSRQALHQARVFGVFLHFGPNTFANLELGDGNTPPNLYAPPARTLNPAQWVATAKAGGASYVIAIAKHHEGFTMWKSSDTTYGINSEGSGNKTDIIGAVAAACASQGMKFAIYYSVWDRKRNPEVSDPSLDAAYHATMMTHLSELFSNYGPLCELWLDGAWEKEPARWGLAAIYKLFREKQPLGVMMCNHTIGEPAHVGKSNGYGIAPEQQKEGDPVKYTPTDFRSWDTYHLPSGMPGAGGISMADPKLFTSGGQTYFLPFEAPQPVNTNTHWFWNSTDGDTGLNTIPWLMGFWFRATGQKNVCVINLPPNTAGVISRPIVAHFNALAEALGLSAGAPLVDKADGRKATASSEYSAVFTADKVTLGQVRGGPRWSAADADLKAPWIRIDLGSAQVVSRVAVKEWYDAALNHAPRVGTYEIQTSADALAWTTRARGSSSAPANDESGTMSFPWGVYRFSPVEARYVRVLFGTVSQPPTLNAVRVY